MNERLQTINDVRALLDWLETHEEVDLPYDFTNGFMISAPTERDEIAALARSFGECEKQFADDHFYLRKRFGSASLYGFTSRAKVCERVVVGTEMVPERITPAYEREIVEWRCDEPLLNGEGQ